jgi:hypothetical protein
LLTAAQKSSETDAMGAGRMVRRLAKLLRPYCGLLIFAMVLLLLSTICDIFPRFVWKYE